MKKRGLALLLTLAMIFSMFPMNTYATEFFDMPDDWSTKALENAVANGLLKGDNGKIMPNDGLTRAQMATIVNRAFGTFEKSSIGDKLYPDNNIIREEAFVVLVRALKLSGANENNLDMFSDSNNISDWAKESVSSLVAAGYIAGSNGQINPKQNITRAEFAQIMDNLVKNYISTSGTYTTDYSGNLMINTPSVTLKGITVTGDLIIGDGVGDGDVTLDDVIVTGRVLVRGGGENSIRIIGNSNIQNIIIARVDGIVRVYAEDGTEIGEIIADGNDDVIVEGNFGTITIVAPDITVTAINATIESALIEGNNSRFIVGETSTIDTIIVNSPGATISGEGTVKSVTANANNVAVTTPETSVTAGKGATGITAGDKEVEPDETLVVPKEETPAPSFGGGGESSTVAVRAISVPTDLTLMAGGATATITARIFPENATNKAVTWTSSDATVATVSNGVVTPIATGTAIITATSVADRTKTATTSVHIIPIEVSGITVTPTLIITYKDSYSLIYATIFPANATNKNVVWSSSNTSVATIVDGKVATKTGGAATITATTIDGSKTATTFVNVVSFADARLFWLFNEAFRAAGFDTKDLTKEEDLRYIESFLDNFDSMVDNLPNIDGKVIFLERYISFKTTVTAARATFDNSQIATAKELIAGATYTMTQAAATDEATVKTAIESVISGLALDGVTPVVTNVLYTPAIAGDAGTPAGTDGTYTFTVGLSKGAATDTTEILTMAITAIAYDS